MTEEELRTIVDVGQEDGVIEDEERDMIHNVFDFGDAEAKEVMVPRIDMTFVHVDSTYDDLISIFREDKFTRLPVYDESTDNVIGIVNMKDLLLLKDEDKEHFPSEISCVSLTLHMSTRIQRICFSRCANHLYRLPLS